MLYTEDFSVRHYVGFSQIGSHLTENISLVIKFKVKCFRRYMTSSTCPIFLPWTYIANDNSQLFTLPQWSNWPWQNLVILIATTIQLLHTTHHPTLHAVWVAVRLLSACWCLFIDQRLLVPAWRWPGNMRQVYAVTSCSGN